MKHTKKALVSASLALLLCFAMLVGTTFAWFTDSVTSANNIIKSGKLKVAMQWSEDGANWKDASTNKLFDETMLWEPGYTAVRYVKISNAGNLALKYQLNIKANGAAGTLADVIDVYYADADALPSTAITRDNYATELTSAGTLGTLLSSQNIRGVLLPEGETKTGFYTKDVYVVLALHMQESAGNEYQDISVGGNDGFDLQLLATQYTYEADGFDDQYDAAAPVPDVLVDTATGLTAALTEGGNILVNDNIDTSTRFNLEKDTTIDGNGKTIKIDNSDNRVMDISDTTGPVEITLNNITLDGSDAKIDSAYARGISLYGNEDVTLNLNKTDISSPYYAINVAGGNQNVEINVKDSSIVSGWAGLNIWSKSTVDVKDSTIGGTNNKTYDSAGWNNFGTIVLNYQDANVRTKDSVLNFENTTIQAKTTTGNRQVLVDLRDDNITMNFTGCTFVSEGTPNGFNDLMFLFCEHENITFTNCTFIKDGVTLSVDQVKNYIGFYDGNNPATSTITIDGTVLSF